MPSICLPLMLSDFCRIFTALCGPTSIAALMTVFRCHSRSESMPTLSNQILYQLIAIFGVFIAAAVGLCFMLMPAYVFPPYLSHVSMYPPSSSLITMSMSFSILFILSSLFGSQSLLPTSILLILMLLFLLFSGVVQIVLLYSQSMLFVVCLFSLHFVSSILSSLSILVGEIFSPSPIDIN